MEDHSPSHDMPFSSPSLGMYTAISPSTGHSICIHLLTLSLVDTHRHPCGLSQQTIQVDNIPSTSSIVLAPSHPLAKSPSHRRTCACSHRRTPSPPSPQHRHSLNSSSPGYTHHPITVAHTALWIHEHCRRATQRRLDAQLDDRLHRIAPSRNSLHTTPPTVLLARVRLRPRRRHTATSPISRRLLKRALSILQLFEHSLADASVHSPS